jgi:hypothetical protein
VPCAICCKNLREPTREALCHCKAGEVKRSVFLSPLCSEHARYTEHDRMLERWNGLKPWSLGFDRDFHLNDSHRLHWKLETPLLKPFMTTITFLLEWDVSISTTFVRTTPALQTRASSTDTLCAHLDVLGPECLKPQYTSNAQPIGCCEHWCNKGNGTPQSTFDIYPTSLSFAAFGHLFSGNVWAARFYGHRLCVDT